VRSTVLLAGLFLGAQLAVLLVVPSPVRSSVTDWLRTAVAWLAFLGLLLIGRWCTRTSQPGAVVWWLLSGALLAYAMGQSLVVGYNQLHPSHIQPVVWWSDVFFLLEYPCFVLALVLWPGIPAQRRSALARLNVGLDSLLLMAAVTALCWYFLLAPIYLHSPQSALGKATALSYAVGDLGVLLGLGLLLVRTRRLYFPALVILILATLALLLGDAWFAALNLHAPYVLGGGPDLCWMLASLLVPLAGVVQIGVLQHRVAREPERHCETEERQTGWCSDLRSVFRLLAPFATALLAGVLIAVRAIIAPLFPVNLLAPSLVIFGLLLLALVRQGASELERIHLRREQQRAHARELAAQAREEAMQELNRRKDEFLGVVSHELKTPLTSLLGYIQLMAGYFQSWRLESEGPNVLTRNVAKARRAIEYSEESVHRMTRLVDDLIDIARIEAGRLTFHLEPCDVRTIVEQAVREQRVLDPDRTIRLELAHSHPVPVIADATRVGQVVTNYLTNALKYSAVDRPVYVRLDVADAQARVSVRDEGIGVPLPEQAHVWERFHRVEGNKVQSGSGVSLGLGLHISKTIIDHHQGQVGVESLPGQGSTFWFTLPLMPLEGEEGVAMRS
jgi:signal transduction histidine kinase